MKLRSKETYWLLKNGLITPYPSLQKNILIMIGTVLVIEGLHVHVPKGYIYVSMAFALGIEVINMRIHRKSKRVVKSNTNNDQIGAEEILPG
jgi:predicted tellurium resistance membrane protein TerC